MRPRARERALVLRAIRPGQALVTSATIHDTCAAHTTALQLARTRYPEGFQDYQRATISGTVARFTLTPRGDLDCLILSDKTQVHVLPHLSDQLAAAVTPGNFVTVAGYRSPTGVPFIATSVTNTASRTRLRKDAWRDSCGVRLAM